MLRNTFQEDLNSIWNDSTSDIEEYDTNSDIFIVDTESNESSDYNDSTDSGDSGDSAGSDGSSYSDSSNCSSESYDSQENYQESTNINRSTMRKLNNLSRHSYSVKYDDVEAIKLLFKSLGIPIYTAPGEADSLCAYFYSKYKDIIDGCLTIDMDSLPRGCEQIINISKGSVVCYDLDNILKMMQLNRTQFVELCILLGCDFEKCVPRIKAEDLYNRFKLAGSLEEFIRIYSQEDPGIIRYLTKYQEVRKMFLQPDNKDFDKITFEYTIKPLLDSNEITNFMLSMQKQSRISDKSIKLLYKMIKLIYRSSNIKNYY
jgi:hypothetical protein